MLIPVPSLSPAGWLKTPAEQADTLIAHAFAANKSQTALYGNNVTSIQWIIERYNHDIPTMAQQINDALKTYFERYFPEGVDIDVYGDPGSDVANNKIVMRIIINFVSGGKNYNLPSIIDVVNGKFAKLSRLNNTGILS